MLFYCMIFMAFRGMAGYQAFTKTERIEKIAVSNIIVFPTAVSNGINVNYPLIDI